MSGVDSNLYIINSAILELGLRRSFPNNPAIVKTSLECFRRWEGFPLHWTAIATVLYETYGHLSTHDRILFKNYIEEISYVLAHALQKADKQ